MGSFFRAIQKQRVLLHSFLLIALLVKIEALYLVFSILSTIILFSLFTSSHAV